MKFKRFFTTLALSSLLMSGALFAGQSAKTHVAKADATDLGTITFDSANGDSTNTWMYGINWTTNDAPAGWDSVAFAPVDENSGTFVNGSRVGTEIKKIEPYTYYIPVPGGQIGTVATVKGTWSNGSYQFTVNDFTRQCVANSGAWEYALEDYDVVSLEDANMPDFEYAAINTEDNADYAYVTDAAALPMRKGYFGLTNDTGSYAFQFNFKKEVQSAGWVDVRIGGSGSWGTGHFLKFSFSNEWNQANGCAYVYEYLGNGDIWNPTELQKSPEFVPGCFDGQHTIEIGAIKVIGYNLHYVFFKTDGTVKWSSYWTLNAAGMTTKVGIYYGNADVKISNSINVVATEKFINPGGTNDIGLHTTNDLCPAIGDWSTYFKSVDGNGLQMNGTPFGGSNWNYFKKTSATSYDLYLPDAGIASINEGDVLHIGGIFKGAKEVNGVKVLYKFVIADSDFEFNGTAWVAVNAAYTASVFAQELLDLTDAVCSGYDGHANNHDALVTIWTTLGGSEKYGAMVSLEKLVLSGATADEHSDDVVEKAMARYDYLTGKYSLTNFITGRSPVSSAPTFYNVVSANSNDTFIVIAIAAASALAVGLFLMLKKKKHE